MNTTLPVRQIGIAGQFKDMHSPEIPTNGVGSARSCRIEDHALRSYSNARQWVTGVFLFAHPFWHASGGGWIAVSLEAGAIKVEFIDVEGHRADITPVGGLDATATEWHAVQLGERCILTNNGEIDNPQWTGEGHHPLVDIPGWPTEYKASVIAVYRNFLFAVGITRTGADVTGEESRLIKWSHPYAAGDEQTYWDFTDPTLLAGETLLAEPGRSITGLQPYRDSLMIYFDRKTWKASFVGGQYVFNFEQVFNDDGCIGPYSFCTTHDGAIVFGHRDIYIHDGHTKKSITDMKMTRYIYDNVDLKFSPVAAWFPKRNEVMFLCRSRDQGEANLMLIANTIHGYAWTEVVAEVAGEGMLSHIAVGPAPADDATARAHQVDTSDTLLGASQGSSSLFHMDYSGATNAVTLFRRDALIEHKGIDLDEIGAGANKIIYLNRILPQMSGEGVVKFTIGTHNTPDGTITWKPPVNYDMGNADQYAVDIRAAGRYLAYRIEPADPDNPALFSLVGMDLELSAPRGKR